MYRPTGQNVTAFICAISFQDRVETTTDSDVSVKSVFRGRRRCGKISPDRLEVCCSVMERLEEGLDWEKCTITASVL